MPKTVMPMTFDEFRRSRESADDQHSFRDRSTANIQRALGLIAGWVQWEADGAAGA